MVPYISRSCAKRVAIHLADPRLIPRIVSECVPGQIPGLRYAHHPFTTPEQLLNLRISRHALGSVLTAGEFQGSQLSSAAAHDDTSISLAQLAMPWQRFDLYMISSKESCTLFKWISGGGAQQSQEWWIAAHIRVVPDCLGEFEPQRRHTLQILLVHYAEASHLDHPDTGKSMAETEFPKSVLVTGELAATHLALSGWKIV